MKTRGALALSLFFTFVFANAAHANMRCADLFSNENSFEKALYAHGAIRGGEKPIEDWNSERGFRVMLQEAEKMGQVRALFDKKLDTRIYYTATGLPDASLRIPIIDPDAKAVVVFFHGSGTAQSGGINFVHNMNKLATLGFSAMSFDMPFHADGPVSESFYDSTHFIRWVRQVVNIARASGKPVYLVGHSFGPDVIAEYLYHYPHDVQGAALLSPAGFNQTLKDWYDSHTSKMRFGGEVAESTLGGEWADRVTRGFIWSKHLPNVVDPTVANPNLRIEVLSGDREEYVPSPTGGKNKTPTGRNTYDLKAALQPLLKNANITLEPGIGHYIFDHNDRNGQNVVMRTIYSVLGFDSRREQDVAIERAKVVSARPAWVQLEQMIAGDRIFRSWLVATHQSGYAKAIASAAQIGPCEKLIAVYRGIFRARANELKK
jgi:pimeloyl-ACP methyl ester carboxylesterase